MKCAAAIAFSSLLVQSALAAHIKPSPTPTPTAVPTSAAPISPPAPTSTAPTTPAPGGLYFDRIFVVVMENEDINSVISDPNFANIASKGRLLTNYHGITHPSEPNYLAMIAGDYFGITDDNNHNISATTIVDLLEAKGITWKSYNQKYVQGSNEACNLSTGTTDTCPYKRKHNPFVSFTNIQNTSGAGSRCSKIVGTSEKVTDTTGNTLFDDMKANNLAQFVFYVPEQCNDGHDTAPNQSLTAVQYSGKFLIDNFFSAGGYATMLDGVTGSTLLVITYDEGDTTAANANTVYTVMIPYGTPSGTASMSVNAGEECAANYNHYSLLRVIEDNWSLGNLGRNDVTANPLCTGTTTACGC